jgi:hypothetical protein
MKTLKALGMVASLGLATVLVTGCNPDEPAKTTTPPPSTTNPPAVNKPKPSDNKGEAPKPTTTKETTK